MLNNIYNYTLNNIISFSKLFQYSIGSILFLPNKRFQIELSKFKLIKILYFLKYHTLFQYKSLIDIIVIDYPKYKKRFDIIYLLNSFKFNNIVLVNIRTDELTPIITITRLYSSANWLEREIWDLFGIFFVNNPDLRRLLLDYGFQGHPLRKDFPLSGYVEVYYNEIKQLIAYKEKPTFSQEFRNFDAENPWYQNYKEKIQYK